MTRSKARNRDKLVQSVLIQEDRAHSEKRQGGLTIQFESLSQKLLTTRKETAKTTSSTKRKTRSKLTPAPIHKGELWCHGSQGWTFLPMKAQLICWSGLTNASTSYDTKGRSKKVRWEYLFTLKMISNYGS